MANLLEVTGSVIPVGSVIDAVGPPDTTWKKCNGEILDQSAYPAYVANAYDLHPLMWKDWDFVDVDQSVIGTIKYGISNINNLIVCVGSGSTVWRSTDGGATWGTNTNLSTGTHYCLANNGTRFVTAQYNSSTAYYSTDGITWNSVTLPYTALWKHLTYANGYFVLMHSSSTGVYAYSSDGITWNSGTFPVSGGAFAFLASDGNAHYCFCYAIGGQYRIHSTTDGQNWSSGTSDFFDGSPYYNDNYPDCMLCLNGEKIIHWYFTEKWFTRFIGSDVKDRNDWYQHQCQPMGNISNFQIKHGAWTGEHYIIPNNYSSEDGILVGKEITNLTAYRNTMAYVQGIVNNGDAWAVVLPLTQNYTSVGRCTGVPYDKATKFQLPYETVPNENRIYKYIKMVE